MIWRPLVFRYSFHKETVTYLVVGFRDFMYLFSTCFTHSSKIICFPAFKALFAHSSALHFYMNIASTACAWLWSFLGRCVRRIPSVLLPLNYSMNHFAAWLHWLKLCFWQLICSCNFNSFVKGQIFAFVYQLFLNFVPNTILSLIIYSGS